MIRWLSSIQRGSQDVAARARFVPLMVEGRAMCCAVGHHARAATAAMNARINHFRGSDFVDGEGRTLMSGMVNDLSIWGAQRQAALLRQVLLEIVDAARHVDWSQVPVIINGPEPSRQGLPIEAMRESLATALKEFGLHPDSQVLAGGQGGIAEALHLASELLVHGSEQNRKPPKHVMLVGLDSLLFAGSIEQLIAVERLPTRECADGCIPAEGAAALLLCLADRVSATPSPHAGAMLHIESAALTEELWRLLGKEPQRGLGLTQAVRNALQDAGTTLPDLDFHLSGMTGEAWYAREVALMQSRCMTHKRTHFEHLIPAQFFGFCGGAVPVLSLAWLADTMARPNGLGPGRSALLHFADACGARSALVVRHRQAAAPKS